MQLFSEVGSVQDAHLQPGRDRGYTYGSVLRDTAMFDNFDNIIFLPSAVLVAFPCSIKFLLGCLWQSQSNF